MDYNKLLENLQPVAHQIFRHGLSATQIQSLEENLHLKFPKYYYEFLIFFGFQQDFVPGLFTDEATFLEQNSYLQDADESDNYLMIGDDGGEHYWLIRTDQPSNPAIFNWEDDEIEPTNFTFSDLLQQALEQRTAPYTIWESNENKVWHVEFHIKTQDEALLFAAIPLELTSDWVEQEKEDNEDNATFVASALLAHKKLAHTKKELIAQQTNNYSFRWLEPVLVLGENSQVRAWEKKLQEHQLSYALLDFGILPAGLFIEES